MSRSHDDVTLQRFLDGALDAAAADAFRTRLAAEPALRQELAAAQRLRAGFVAGHADAVRAPAGFTAAVLAAARRLPDRQQLERQDLVERVARTCRRLLLAAAVLFCAGLVSQSGLFEGTGGKLEAAPDEIRSEMERLDARIRAGLEPAREPSQRGEQR